MISKNWVLKYGTQWHLPFEKTLVQKKFLSELWWRICMSTRKVFSFKILSSYFEILFVITIWQTDSLMASLSSFERAHIPIWNHLSFLSLPTSVSYIIINILIFWIIHFSGGCETEVICAIPLVEDTWHGVRALHLKKFEYEAHRLRFCDLWHEITEVPYRAAMKHLQYFSTAFYQSTPKVDQRYDDTGASLSTDSGLVSLP